MLDAMKPQTQLRDCWLMDLLKLGIVNHFGSWDVRGVSTNTSATDPFGKTLDVGCASGFLSFEVEKRGAMVTSFDVDTSDIDPKTDAATKRLEVVKMQNGYRLAHRLLNSKVRIVYGDAR